MTRAQQTGTYTAATLAAGLGVSKQAAHKALAGILPTETKSVPGGKAGAWALDVVPARMREDLAERARLAGYRNAEHMLTVGDGGLYQPAIPRNEIHRDSWEQAEKLQRALAEPIARRNSQDGLTECGLAHYAREFGYQISARHWNDLFKRTLERDGGNERFDRVELYLPDKLKRVVGAKTVPAEFTDHPLSSLVKSFRNPAAPSRDEIAALWLNAFEHVESETAAGRSAKRLKRDVIRFLVSQVPSVFTSHEGTRKQFERKHQAWIAEGRQASAVKDHRPIESGRWRGPEVSQEDRDKIIGHSVLFCGGRVAQAYRELCEKGELSESILSYYRSSPARKSYVPRRILESVTHEVKLLDAIHHGPRQAKLNGAHIERNWSNVCAMDWFCADDTTLPVYYYTPDGELIRGQFLVLIDLRSTCVLATVLIDKKGYSARAIRRLITLACEEHGLPRRGFLFEGGIWERSRLIKGDRNADPLSPLEMELGFRDLHLEFRHSRLPRSKPVERVIGALQYLMEGECGYVGRDEKKERFERIQKLMLDVRAGRASADKVLYSADQWRARLKEICSAYNAEVQNGKMTRGLSPEEAFLQFNPPGNPPVKYDARCRYLLSTHKKPVKVTPSGIVLPKTWFDDPFDGRLYANKATSHLVGQRVLVWFNPDTPELITVTDMNRKNPICVERNLADAMDESRESLAELKARCNGHNSFARERYTVLKLRHPQTIRPNRVSEADAELGRRINEFEAAAKEQRTQRQRRVTRANRAARSLDHYRPEGIEDRPEAVEALERLSRTLNEPDSEESEVRQ